MSAYFQKHRKEYFDRLLALSKDHDWEGWIRFFLKGVVAQGELLCKKAEKLQTFPRTSNSR
jgi:Fic family protein